MECVKYADEDMYPNIRVLLIIGCTLPISSAEAERSFSGLRRIKSYLRNRMSDEQLSVETNLSNHYVKFYIYHYEYQRLLIKPITISRPTITTTASVKAGLYLVQQH